MNRSLNEELFDRVMRLPHAMRMRMQAEAGPQPMPRHPGDGGRFEAMPRRPHEGGRFEPMPHHPGGEGRPEGMPRHGRHGGPGGERRAPFARERALELLLESGEGLRQKEIGERLGINPSSTSEFVSRLEEDGYVRREADPQDGRATRIALSELGRARANELRDEQAARFEALFGGLTDDEKRELIRLLDKLFAGGRPGNLPVQV